MKIYNYKVTRRCCHSCLNRLEFVLSHGASCCVCCVSVCGVRLLAASSGNVHIHFASTLRVPWNHYDTLRFDFSVHTLVECAANDAYDAHRHRSTAKRMAVERGRNNEYKTHTLTHILARLLHNKSRWRNHDNGGTWTKIFVQALPRQCAQRNIKSFYLLYRIYAKVHNCFSYVLFFLFVLFCFVRSLIILSVCAVVSGTQKTIRRPECGWLQCMQFIFEYQIL